MQSTFSIPAADFNTALFEKIKAFLQEQNADVFIRIKTKETQKEMNLRINNAIEEIEKNENLVSFSAEEFDTLTKSLRS